MLAIIVALALQSAAPPSPAVPTEAPPAAGHDGHPPEGAMHGLIRIFDTLCNQVFPDDARLAKIGNVPNTRELTAQELKTYLKDDPGRGWISSKDGATIVVTIEAPPFHTCTVRMPHTDGEIDERMWRAVVERMEAIEGGGFQALPSQTIVSQGARQIVVGDSKQFPDGSAEAFYLFRTTAVEPAKAPDYQVEIRLVRQRVAPGAEKLEPKTNAKATITVDHST